MTGILPNIGALMAKTLPHWSDGLSSDRMRSLQSFACDARFLGIQGRDTIIGMMCDV